MKLGVFALVAALALTAAGDAVAGPDPHGEKVRLTAADVALARSVSLRASDFGAAPWTQVASQYVSRSGCAGFSPDFSRFTITGRAQTAFRSPVGGAQITSAVEVYQSRADAIGDFQTGTQPGLARCIADSLTSTRLPGVTTTLLSARMVTVPRIGERSAGYRATARLAGSNGSVIVYVDVIGFQRGRSFAALFFTGAGEPVSDRVTLARAVATRMR